MYCVPFLFLQCFTQLECVCGICALIESLIILFLHYCLPLSGALPAVCLPRHIWTHNALFEDQSGLPVLSSAALAIHPAE